jgi:hypothetical protein
VQEPVALRRPDLKVPLIPLPPSIWDLALEAEGQSGEETSLLFPHPLLAGILVSLLPL